MQFLWKHIDDLLGKGYSTFDFLELIFYFGVGVVPMALPLTVLLSTVMTYGEMAEKYELTAIKSSGSSLLRMLRPGLVVAILTMILSILASNFFKPEATKQYLKKMRSMKTNQLTFAFDEKVFNTEFKNYSIWIDSKDDDGKSLEGILIYDHSDPDKSIVNMIQAHKGQMYTTPDEKFLVMELKDGYIFKEVRGEASSQNMKNFNQMARPVNRVKFKSLRKSFELSELLNLNLSTINSQSYDMMNSMELIETIDSLEYDIHATSVETMYDFNKLTKVREPETILEKYGIKKDTSAKASTGNLLTKAQRNEKIRQNIESVKKREIKRYQPKILDMSKVDTAKSISSIIYPSELYDVMSKAITNAMATRDRAYNKGNEVRMKSQSSSRFVHRLHQQYSSALVCLIFLFIGGPAGAIVRKGGFGLPLLVAIVFYMTFIMTSITGEKLVKSQAASPIYGAWLPCIILFPFAIFLTYMALNDRNISGFSWDDFKTTLRSWISKKRGKSLSSSIDQ